MRRLIAAMLVAAGLGAMATPAQGQQEYLGTERQPDYTTNRFFYYPYYYFPANYWPQNGPKWPEPIGAPYMPPPAYMAYPPFKEPHWRYYWYQGLPYYRGFHFWLDQF
jgi:hypothetical protein